MYLSWIIPAYNEEKRIEKTIREVDAYLKSQKFPGGYEIIVVDSSSRDRTQEIIKNLQSQIPRLQLLIVKNLGKGWAVGQGMLKAQGEIRLFSDADNSTSPDHFNKMIPLFEMGFDVVISSRNPLDVPGASQDVPESILRRLAGRAGNLIIQLVALRSIWDTKNGFKAFRRRAAEYLFPRQKIQGFAFDIEILALARLRGFTLSIIPVRWRHSPESKVTLKSYFEVLRDVFKIRWNLMTHKYEG